MMKTNKMRVSHWVWMVVLLGFTGLSMAAVPPERVNLQGVLRDNAGAPVNGAQAMTFRLYDTGAGCPGGGTRLLTDDHASVTASGGLFTVALGGGTVTAGTAGSLGGAFRANAEVWVEIEVAGDGGMCPRVRVESAAYAQMAGGLNTLADVGIGTTSPSADLHMFYGDGILMQGDSSSNLTLKFQDDDTGQDYEIRG